MSRHSPKALLCLLTLCAGLPANATPPQKEQNTVTATIRRVAILGRGNNVEIEIAASQHVVPQTQVLSGPDRVVIDFPGAVPGATLRPVVVNRGDVKAVRVGLFGANPPVTRVVLDLKSPQGFLVFPSGNTVIVKVGSAPGGNSAPPSNSFIATVVAGHPQIRPPAPHPGAAVKPAALVSFENGLLSVKARKATLAQVLFEVHQQTGADIAVPAGAELEQVVADLGPAPAKDVLAALLNGTNYNFILLGSDGDATIQRVILSPKSGGSVGEAYVPPDSSQAAPVPQISEQPLPEPTAAVPVPDMPPDQNNPAPSDPPPN